MMQIHTKDNTVQLREWLNSFQNSIQSDRNEMENGQIFQWKNHEMFLTISNVEWK